MSKKVDLNAPRKVPNDYKKSRNNHSFSHARPTVNNNSNFDSGMSGGNDAMDSTGMNTTGTTTGTNSSTNRNSFGKRVAERGLRMAGLTKGAASNVNNMEFSDKVKVVIKFIPPQVKIILVAIIVGLPLIGLMIFVVLFSSAGASDASDYLALAETCSTITVTDTGCDNNGGNCTHEYDGEVSFEDYIAGVVAGLGDGAQNAEFYKTLAVVARTYFLANAGSDCNVLGNNSFMEYKDISVASDREAIVGAVKDTSKTVILNSENELMNVSYSMACVVNNEGNKYYLRYGADDVNYQKIPSSFDGESQIYRGKLGTLYNGISKTEANYENRGCPNGNDSTGLSLIGALYLAKEQNYNYQKILSYYYGEINEARAEGTYVGNLVDGFMNPVSNFYKCTSSFGCRVHPITGGYRYHSGIDIPVVEGTPVYAVKSGRITAVRTDVTGYLAGSYGNYVDIDHLDGTMTRYAHLKYGGVMVSVGMMVNQGQAIALSGNTGGSTGPHLHYEVHVNGVPVDPYNFLDTSVIGDAGSCNYGKSIAASYCGR